jgi:hypothetical protein
MAGEYVLDAATAFILAANAGAALANQWRSRLPNLVSDLAFIISASHLLLGI